MRQPGTPSNEAARLRALKRYNILDTLPEKDFDDITRIASEICQTPIATITLIDENRQWFKSKVGLVDQETSRDIAFCAHAILQPEEMLIVPDSREDERFRDNPLVTGEPWIQFYAGVPLVNPEGYPLGTLCIIDKETRQLTAQQITSLKALANQVVAQFELRLKVEELHQSQTALKEANQALETFAYNASHDLKNPLNNIIALTDLLRRQLPDTTTDDIFRMVHHLSSSANRLKDMVDSLLEFSRVAEITAQEKETVDIHQLMEDITSLMNIPAGFNFNYTEVPPLVITSRTALQHILVNLCTNAVKYNDKGEGSVQLTGTEEDTHYTFRLQDNGMGIPEESFPTIFRMFSTLGQKDRFNEHGTGLGLYIVKKLVEKLGGEIRIHSKIGKGTTFEFTLAKDLAVSS